MKKFNSDYNYYIVKNNIFYRIKFIFNNFFLLSLAYFFLIRYSINMAKIQISNNYFIII